MIVDTTSIDLGVVQLQDAGSHCFRELRDLELDDVDGGVLGMLLGGAAGAAILFGVGYIIGRYS